MEEQHRESNDDSNYYDFWKVFVKRKKLIIGLFLIAVISTTIVSLFMQKIYRGEVKLSIIDKRAEGAKEIIDLMGSIDDEKKKLIFPKTYTSVKSVKIVALKNVANEISTTIEAINTDVLPVAIVELVDSLNNMEILKADLKKEREILTQRSIELSNILKTAKELAGAYNRLIREGKYAAIGFNPLELNKNIVDFKNEKFAVDQALSKLKNGRIQIVTPPSISNKPVSPKTLQNIYFAGLLSLFIGLALAFFMEYIEKIRNKKK